MDAYKIKSILHSGREGVRGTERVDGRYPLCIGRTVGIVLKYLVVGIPLNIKDEKGNDYSGYYLQCSRIQNIHIVSKKIFTVETDNSIYELEREEN